MTLLSSLMLPQVGKGDEFGLLPFGTQDAYAQSTTQSSSQTEIVIVSRTEIGIVAYDMTDPQKPVPVPECTVELYSRFNKKSLQGKTDEKGLIVFDLTDLCEDPSADILGFNGSLRVSFDGYREVYIPLTRIESHSAIVAPTRPLDGNPYFISLAMNEWDIQYSKQEFVTLPGNKESVTIEAELWLEDTSAAPQAQLLGVKDGTIYKLADFKVSKVKENSVELVASGKFLQRGADICFDAFDEFKVDLLPANANSAYLTSLNVEASPSPLEASSEGSDFIVPSAASSVLNIVKVPTTFPPPFGGGTLDIWKPSLPVIFDFSIFGYALFGVGYSSVKVKKDDGSFFSRDSWETLPRESASQQYETAVERSCATIDACAASDASSGDPADTKTVWHNFMSDYRIYINVQAFCSLEYKWDKELWEGALTAIFSAKLDCNFTRQFWLGSIPMYVNINAWASFQLSWRCGATTTKLFSFDWKGEDTALGFGFSFGLGLTIGAGFMSLISVSFTAAGYLTSYFSVLSNPTKYPVRVLAGFGHSGVVTLQLPLVKYTYPLWNVNEPTYYDSAKNKADLKCFEGEAPTLSKSQLDSFYKERLGAMGMRDSVPVHTDGFPSWEELCANAVLVTNKELGLTVEFETSKAGDFANAPVSIQLGKGAFKALDGQESYEDVIVVPKIGVNTSNDYLPSYRYVGKTNQLAVNSFGVAGFSSGSRGGIRPEVDHLMFAGVHSNTQLKVLVTNGWGRTIMFRIASVDIGDGTMRRRLVYHLLDKGSWGEPHVVNFDPQIDGVSRDDLYDYEFDVTQALGNTGSNYIYLLVTHGTRPDGDDTSFARTLQAHYVSLVALQDTNASPDPLQAIPSMTAGLPSTTEGYTLTAPSITGFSDTFSIAGTNDFCVMGFFTRCKVSEQTGIANDGLTIGFFGRMELDSSYQDKVFKVSRIRAFQSGWLGGTNFTMLPVQIEDDSYRWEYGSVAACRRAIFAIPGDQSSTIGRLEARYDDHDSSKFASFGCKELSSTKNSKLKVNRFYPWGNDGQMLAACLVKDDDGQDVSVLYHVQFDPADASSPTYTQIGPKTGAPTDFVVDNGGKYLFYIENIDGKTGQSFDEDGNAGDDVVEHRHYIMAVTQVDGIFTKPFVFCELDHVIDDLVSATVDNSYVSFMASTITDIDKSIGDIYDVRVPLVKCINVKAFFSTDAFALSGEECTFSATVTNDGNLVARAATFNFYDADEDVLVESKRVVFADDSSASPELEDMGGLYNTSGFSASQLANPLVKGNGVAVLTPGESRSLQVKFTIPEDWSDKKNVLLKISDVEVVNGANLTAMLNVISLDSSSKAHQLSVDNSVDQELVADMGTGAVSVHAAREFGSYPSAQAPSLKRPSGFTAKGKRKKVVLRWKKASTKTTGVEVKWARKKNKLGSAKTVKVKRANVRKHTVKNLKSKKRYFFKVRTYKIVGSKTYRSPWSVVRSAKTK